jgi:hypothetical protein
MGLDMAPTTTRCGVIALILGLVILMHWFHAYPNCTVVHARLLKLSFLANVVVGKFAHFAAVNTSTLNLIVAAKAKERNEVHCP